MAGIHNLKPEGVIRAFERAGWENLGRYGKHYKLRKAGNPNILSVPVHKGKPIKAGLLRDLIKRQGWWWRSFWSCTGDTLCYENEYL